MALSATESAALTAFAGAVRGVLGSRAVAVTLFGSRARGEGREDSDLDVLVVVEALDLASRRAVQDAGWEASMASGLVLSPISVDAAGYFPDLPLAREVARDGVPL